MFRKTFFILFYGLPQIAFSQQGEFSSGNASAVRALEQALTYYENRHYDKALETADMAIQRDPLFVEAYMLRGNIYDDQKKFDLSILNYQKAIQLNADFFPNNYFSLANAQYRLALYDSAITNFNRYIAHPKSTERLVKNARYLLANCEFAKQAIKHPVKFDPLNLGDSMNSADDEILPTITADGRFLLFTRQGKTIDMMGRGSRKEDFYISEKKDGVWLKAKPLAELNTPGNEGASCFAPDGQYLFFTGCESNFGYPEEREKGLGSCDIYISKKVGNKFQAPRNLGAPINSQGYETQPSFSSDGRTLYFIRKVKNAEGKWNQDIYVSIINDQSKWSEPIPLPSNINTPYEEMSVFIHPDDRTLYFASNGHPGMGGLDLFYARRKPDGSWDDPVNMGYPINTSADESSLLVSPDGSVAYFASGRSDTRGGLDLYQFTMPDHAKPTLLTYLKGIVYDSESKAKLSANFELIDLQSGKVSVRSTSDEITGEFLVCLPSGKQYALNVSKDGYLFYSDNFQLTNPASAKDPFLKDIPLKPIRKGQSIVLKNIFYETDKYDLKEESKIELEKAIQFMEKNKQVLIEISGHTDNTGTRNYNQTLSENRARTVLEYFVRNGIPRERLSYKGFADTVPVASNNTEDGRSQNRRTEFTIADIR